MNTEKLLARNTAVQVVGKALATVFGIVTVGVLTRYLGADGYGDFTLVITFVSLFAILVDFGLTLTTVQMISEKKADEDRILANLLSLRILSAVVFLSLAPIVALFFPYEHLIIVAIAVGAFSFLFGTTSQMMIGVFQKRLIIWQAVIAELLNRGAVLLGALLAPAFGLGLVGVIWLLVIGNVIQLLTIAWFAKRHVHLSFKWEPRLIKKILTRSWPIGASIFFNLIYLKGDVIFLSLFRTSEEIGIYGAAYKVVDVMTSLPVMYMGLTLPLLTLAFTSKNTAQFKKTMQDTFDFFALLAVPFIFGSIALGVPVMQLIAGPEFSESGKVLAILGPAASIVFFGALFGHAIVAVNKQRVMVWGYLAVAILTVVGYLAFIPRYGIYAAAWMTLFAEVAITLITATVIFKVSDFAPGLKRTFKILIAGAAMFVFLKFVPLHAVLAILLGSTVYFVVLSSIGGFKIKDVFKLFLPEKPPVSV